MLIYINYDVSLWEVSFVWSLRFRFFTSRREINSEKPDEKEIDMKNTRANGLRWSMLLPSSSRWMRS